MDSHINHEIGREEYVARFNETLELEAMLPEGRRGFDPWALENTKDQGYQRDKFYTETVRQKRHGGNPKNVQVPFEEGDYQIMQRIIQQRLVPAYQTVQDLIRDAVHHRLHDLTHGNYEDGLKVYLVDEEFAQHDERRRHMVRIQMLQKAAKEEAESMMTLGEGLKQAVDLGDRQRVYQLLETAQRILASGGLADRTRSVITELATRYGEWLDRMNRTSFDDRAQTRVDSDYYNPPMPPMP